MSWEKAKKKIKEIEKLNINNLKKYLKKHCDKETQYFLNMSDDEDNLKKELNNKNNNKNNEDLFECYYPFYQSFEDIKNYKKCLLIKESLEKIQINNNNTENLLELISKIKLTKDAPFLKSLLIFFKLSNKETISIEKLTIEELKSMLIKDITEIIQNIRKKKINHLDNIYIIIVD